MTNPIPAFPMLSGNAGSGKVFMVIGVLLVIAMMANKEKQAATGVQP